MNRRMKKKVEKRKAEMLAEACVQKAPKVEKTAPKKEKKAPVLKTTTKTAAKPAMSGDVQLLVSKKIHLYVEEKGKAACGAAQGADTEIKSGAAEDVTCKLCQRSMNK